MSDLKPLEYPNDAVITRHGDEPYYGTDERGFRRIGWRDRVSAKWRRDGQQYGVWWWELVNDE